MLSAFSDPLHLSDLLSSRALRSSHPAPSLSRYISACLAKIEKSPSPKEADKALQTLAFETFALPGQAGFPFNSFFDAAESQGDREELRGYMKQLREETGQRMVKVGFTPEGTPNKFWTAFAKRKFMNQSI